MKSRKIIALLIITNIILIGIICNFISRNGNVEKEKQVIKEMTQSENEANLQTQIDQLNLAHEEYAQNVQNYKKQIAEAITNQGVNTSENATASVMVENIGKVVSAKTIATATAADIASGKTAWVNGNLITGTASKSLEYIDLTVEGNYGTTATTGYKGGISGISGNIFSKIEVLSFNTHVIYTGGGTGGYSELTEVGATKTLSTDTTYYVYAGTVGQGWKGTQSATIRLYFR